MLAEVADGLVLGLPYGHLWESRTMHTAEESEACAGHCTCNSSSRFRRRAAAATRTPARTNTWATAQPMPDEAPVTTATRPCQRFMPSGITIEAPVRDPSQTVNIWNAFGAAVHQKMCSVPL
jgi:hypothetical protein